MGAKGREERQQTHRHESTPIGTTYTKAVITGVIKPASPPPANNLEPQHPPSACGAKRGWEAPTAPQTLPGWARQRRDVSFGGRPVRASFNHHKKTGSAPPGGRAGRGGQPELGGAQDPGQRHAVALHQAAPHGGQDALAAGHVERAGQPVQRFPLPRQAAPLSGGQDAKAAPGPPLSVSPRPAPPPGCRCRAAP